MKRKVTVVLLALAAALLLGLSVFFVACDVGTESGGNEEDDGIFVFALNNEGTAYSVIGMDASAAGSVTIPATYNDLPVTGIGDSAFFSRSNLTEITIPEGVTSIGAYAFAYCSSLTKINYNAMAVSNLSYNSVFYDAGSNSQGCTVTVGESVKSIPAYLFADADITSVTIGSNVESIGLYAFHNCSNLTEINYNAAAVADLRYSSNVFYNAGSNYDGITVTFGESVTSIPAYLFYGSSNLVSVTIGSNVASIGDEAFYHCSRLTKINYNAAAVADLSYNSSVFYNAGSDSDGITVTFGKSVTSIPAYLFYTKWLSYAPNLVSVTIGSNVESIGSSAFSGCSGLTEITIPASVTSIGSSAFYNCDSLTSVTIGAGVTSIGSFAFGYCSNLTEITIPASVASIGSAAFAGCSGLTGVYISDIAAWCAISFDSATANPLDQAENLYLNDELVTELVIPEGVTSIGSYAFYGCSGLTKLTISEGVTSIGSYAFRDCSNLTEIMIPASVTSIGSSAFDDCSGLTEITIPEGVTSIGSYVFGSCTNLTEINYNAAAVADLTSYSNVFYNAGSNSEGCTVTVGESVINIPAYLFESANITSVTIGSNVESIGSHAFEDCSGLTEVTIGAGVTSIGSYAFRGCSNLAEINYNAAAVADLTSDSDVFYNAGSNSDGITVVFGESVKSIPAYLFYGSRHLISVTIGSNVESIGDSAFSSCSGLTGITIPESVASIGSASFNNCSNLTEITIPDSVTSIGSSAFYRCSNLTEITIPASVTSIEDMAFFYCSGLAKITVAEGNSAYHSDGDCLIETATKTLILGCQNSVIPTDGSVTSIGGGAFSGCSSLAEITIPDSVTSIGSWAFSSCSNLTEITIPDSVTSIGSYAFYGCSNLTSVTFENTEGWRYASISGATSGKSLSSSSLENPETAARYLKSTYSDYYWRRS